MQQIKIFYFKDFFGFLVRLASKGLQSVFVYFF